VKLVLEKKGENKRRGEPKRRSCNFII